jgi:hypothetical protein
VKTSITDEQTDRLVGILDEAVRVLEKNFLSSCGEVLRPGRGGSLFRAATTFTEASAGAEKSVGYGGSPKG